MFRQRLQPREKKAMNMPKGNLIEKSDDFWSRKKEKKKSIARVCLC